MSLLLKKFSLCFKSASFSVLLVLSLGHIAWANDCANENTIISQLKNIESTEKPEIINKCKADLLPKIVVIIESNNNPSTRGNAVEALNNIDIDSSFIIPILINVITSDKHPSVRWRAISSLAKLGTDSSKAIPNLSEIVRSDTSLDVKRRAVYALGKISFALQGSMKMLEEEKLDQGIQDLKLAVEILKEVQEKEPETLSLQQIDDVHIPLEVLIQYKNSIFYKKFWRRFSWVLGSHFLFWITLISVYPKNSTVQAIFFWNPWVRRFVGMGYVGIALTWIPFLRNKLFAPFKVSLLSDANLDDFKLNTYFHNSIVQDKRSKKNQIIQTAIPAIKGQIIIEGESGLGKSMFLRYLAQSSRRILVYLPAKRCNHGVIEAIQSKLHGAAKDADFLRSLIYSGALDICIDGLNEVTANTRAQITNFAESNFKGNIIMTTQPVEWQPPSTAKLFVLQPLTREQIEHFLVSRHHASDNLASSEVSSEFTTYKTACSNYLNQVFDSQHTSEEWKSIQHILSNPMDLTFISQILLKGEEPDLFHLQSQQYQTLAKDYKIHYLSDFPLQAFSELAYQMRLNELDIIPSDQFYNELIFMERFKMILSRQSINSLNEPIKEWFFRHEKIMDFFIVQTFLGSNNSKPESHLSDARFRGVYFLLATLLPFNAAMKLRELLIRYAADKQDHSVSDKFIKLLISRESYFEKADSEHTHH